MARPPLYARKWGLNKWPWNEAGGDQSWGSCTRSCSQREGSARCQRAVSQAAEPALGGRSNKHCEKFLRILSSRWQLQPTRQSAKRQTGSLRYEVGAILLRASSAATCLVPIFERKEEGTTPLFLHLTPTPRAHELAKGTSPARSLRVGTDRTDVKELMEVNQLAL